MDTKEYLQQLIKMDKLIKLKEEQVKSLKDLATRVTTNVTHERGANGEITDRTGNIVVKIVNLQDELNRGIEEIVGLKAEIIGKLERLESIDSRLLLQLRYIGGKTWEDIAGYMNFSFQWVHILHKRALEEFSKLQDI